MFASSESTAAPVPCGDGDPGDAWVGSTHAGSIGAAGLYTRDPVGAAARPGRILVLGVGNTLAGDDGFGPAVIEALKAAGRERSGLLDAPGVELSCGGVLGIDLLSELEEIDHLIVVDAVRFGGRGRELERGRSATSSRPDPVPGGVVVIRPGRVELEDPDPRFSLHDLSFGGCLRLARILDLRLPVIDVVGCSLAGEPTGEGLSTAARAAVPEAARQVMRLLSEALDARDAAAKETHQP